MANYPAKAFKHDGMGGTSPLPTPQIPYVEEHEVEEAKALIDKQFIEITGKPFGLRPAGYMIACKLWIRDDELKTGTRPDGSTYTLYTAPVTQQQDALTSVAALVCAVGPLAFKDRETGKEWAEGPYCRPGDWIVIPRQSSFLCEYRGVKMAILPDDKIIGTIEDPTDIAPLYVAPRI